MHPLSVGGSIQFPTNELQHQVGRGQNGNKHSRLQMHFTFGSLTAAAEAQCHLQHTAQFLYLQTVGDLTQ